MPAVSKELRRRVARTLEWFIVGHMANKVPPEERLFLLYEVTPGETKHHPLVQRARKFHGRGGFCIGDFTLVGVKRAQLARVIGLTEWMEQRIDRPSPLAPNEARCVVIQDRDHEPEIIIFGARAVQHHVPDEQHLLEAETEAEPENPTRET